jgi:5-methylcytosine-specific restriction enzyme A
MEHHLISAIHSKTYLLTWNPGKFEWGDFQEDWDSYYSGSRPRFRWSCGNTKSIKVGDRVFLMRLGYQEDVTGIVASGVVTEPPFEEDNWNPEGLSLTAWYVEFEPDVFFNPDTDDLLDPKIVSQEFNWHPQRSGVTIPNEIAIHLEQIWQRHVQRTDLIEVSRLAGTTKSKTYREGSRTLVTSYRYERDPQARDACIRHYGLKCVICGFDFSEAFGAVGSGFIHVHHLLPMSERDVEYTIDPIEDLRPVCPNCHAMLHRKSPPYAIEELRSIRQERRNY